MKLLKRFFQDVKGKQVLITINYCLDDDFGTQDLDHPDDIARVESGEISPYVIHVELFDGEDTFDDYLGHCLVRAAMDLLEICDDHNMIDNVINEYKLKGDLYETIN
jgi:hypothetical protein